MEIKGKTFLVTGGSSGIGKATAKLLADKGGKVAITGRDPEKLRKVAEEINAFGIHADVAKDEDIAKTYETFLEEFGHLDCLVNNAGIGSRQTLTEHEKKNNIKVNKRKELTDLKREDFQAVYDINVMGAAMMGAKAAELFKEQKYGNIVNLGSTASLKGYATGTVYVSSKFALRGMSQCWQAELRPYNVRVIHVNPSEVPTAFGQESREERPEEANKLSATEIGHAIVSSLEMDDRGFIPELTVWATNPF